MVTRPTSPVSIMARSSTSRSSASKNIRSLLSFRMLFRMLMRSRLAPEAIRRGMRVSLRGVFGCEHDDVARRLPVCSVRPRAPCCHARYILALDLRLAQARQPGEQFEGIAGKVPFPQPAYILRRDGGGAYHCVAAGRHTPRLGACKQFRLRESHVQPIGNVAMLRELGKGDNSDFRDSAF